MDYDIVGAVLTQSMLDAALDELWKHDLRPHPVALPAGMTLEMLQEAFCRLMASVPDGETLDE